MKIIIARTVTICLKMIINIVLLAIKRFYSQNLGEAIIRTFAVSFMYLMFVIPTSMIILAVVSFLIY